MNVMPHVRYVTVDDYTCDVGRGLLIALLGFPWLEKLNLLAQVYRGMFLNRRAKDILYAYAYHPWVTHAITGGTAEATSGYMYVWRNAAPI